MFSNLKLIGSLKGDLKSLQRNILAGLIVGIVSIPLSMAFAIASGLRPENGLYTSIIAGIVVATFGGSKVQIAGPTGAFVALLATITAQHGITGLQTASIMAGMLMVVMSIFKLGNLFRFVPFTVILGFTTGIGLIILQTQLHTIFGIQDNLNVMSLIQKPRDIHFPTLMAFGLSIASLLIWQEKIKKIPGPLFLLVFGSFFCLLDVFQNVATIGNTYGTIPSTLPVVALPKFDWHFFVELIQPAFSIALLGSIESILSASAADQMTGDKHHPNRELRGQGLANILAPCWGGFACTGAIARTMTNIRYGADSPLAALVHSFVILMTILCLSNLAQYIPLVVLATILVVIAFHMINISACKKIFQQSNSQEKLTFLVTLVSTLYFDLITGVFLGLVLSVFFVVWDKARYKSLSFDTFRAKELIIEKCTSQQKLNIWVKLPRNLNFINIHSILEKIESYEQSDVEFCFDFSKVFQIDLTSAQEICKFIKKSNKYKQFCTVTGIKAQIQKNIDFFGYSSFNH